MDSAGAAAALRRVAGDGRMPTSAAVCGSTHAAMKRLERCITTRLVAPLRALLLHLETMHSVLPVLALAAVQTLSRHDSEAANNARLKQSIYATQACSTRRHHPARSDAERLSAESLASTHARTGRAVRKIVVSSLDT